MLFLFLLSCKTPIIIIKTGRASGSNLVLSPETRNEDKINIIDSVKPAIQAIKTLRLNFSSRNLDLNNNQNRKIIRAVPAKTIDMMKNIFI